ncbi:hypothetical protein HOD30_02785 [Candidatus Peregrinibacteria bacterium]|jgi:hypothetical protein|nr:hypothetical protein [Candidatus Peregrinibacteria bacterium]MBT4631529.1 hypothetical protein [Candidatus Peregrinibacteria bacterium]MBT5516376.1 hypothetical protein [Candidatus Peregrinibacteria bacterium]
MIEIRLPVYEEIGEKEARLINGATQLALLELTAQGVDEPTDAEISHVIEESGEGARKIVNYIDIDIDQLYEFLVAESGDDRTCYTTKLSDGTWHIGILDHTHHRITTSVSSLDLPADPDKLISTVRSWTNNQRSALVVVWQTWLKTGEQISRSRQVALQSAEVDYTSQFDLFG